jgi:hypothetical protein
VKKRRYGIDDVAAEKQREQAASSTIGSLQTATTESWIIFVYA